jgi:DNA-binding transcriptional MerR regulator
MLYNWERKGKIPKAYRDPMSRWRLYSKEDLEKIKYNLRVLRWG